MRHTGTTLHYATAIFLRETDWLKLNEKKDLKTNKNERQMWCFIFDQSNNSLHYLTNEKFWNNL